MIRFANNRARRVNYVDFVPALPFCRVAKRSQRLASSNRAHQTTSRPGSRPQAWFTNSEESESDRRVLRELELSVLVCWGRGGWQGNVFRERVLEVRLHTTGYHWAVQALPFEL